MPQKRYAPPVLEPEPEPIAAGDSVRINAVGHRYDGVLCTVLEIYPGDGAYRTIARVALATNHDFIFRVPVEWLVKARPVRKAPPRPERRGTGPNVLKETALFILAGAVAIAAGRGISDFILDIIKHFNG